MHCAPKIVEELDKDEDSEEGIYDQNPEQEAAAEEIQEIEATDEAPHQIPDSDEGYVDILNERFGHPSFLEG